MLMKRAVFRVFVDVVRVFMPLPTGAGKPLGNRPRTLISVLVVHVPANQMKGK
jgi:hypothetical protein